MRILVRLKLTRQYLSLKVPENRRALFTDPTHIGVDRKAINALVLVMDRVRPVVVGIYARVQQRTFRHVLVHLLIVIILGHGESDLRNGKLAGGETLKRSSRGLKMTRNERQSWYVPKGMLILTKNPM